MFGGRGKTVVAGERAAAADSAVLVPTDTAARAGVGRAARGQAGSASGSHGGQDTKLGSLTAGRSFRGTYALRRAEVRKTRAGKAYLDVELADATGAVQGKLWNAPADAAELVKLTHVEVEGRTETYRDKLQVNLDVLRPARGPIDPLRFLPRTPHDIRALFRRLGEIHQSIRSPHIRALIRSFLADEGFRRRFLRAPAAVSHHHAYLGGLLEHIVSLSETCCRLAEVYPILDRDLLLAGAFFHDLGKVEELEARTALEYTDRGRLIGHIVTGTIWVDERARTIPGFPRTVLDRLKHMILSHHGTREWGSPVQPLTAEAIALHYADNLDAKMWAFQRLMESEGGGHWTEYSSTFRARMFRGAESPDEGAAGTDGGLSPSAAPGSALASPAPPAPPESEGSFSRRASEEHPAPAGLTSTPRQDALTPA